MSSTSPFVPRRIWVILLVAFGAALLTAWLLLTPPGLLGKADALGYAVCHQIEERVFHLGERPLPLCARCTGIYLGALLGLGYQFCRNRRSGLPAPRVQAVLLIFFLAFVIDSLNSAAWMIPGIQGLYEPGNTLRLFTGLGMGLTISAVFMPIFRDTLYQESDPAPLLSGLRDIFIMTALAVLSGLAFLTGNPLLLYPLSLLSVLGLFTLMALVHAVLWILALKIDNRFPTLRSAWFPLLAGSITALLQFALLDLIRFALTHTWGGLAI